MSVPNTENAIRPITALELAQAADPNGGHGVAAITGTRDGGVMVVCVCDLVGVGSDEAQARAELATAHAGATP